MQFQLINKISLTGMTAPYNNRKIRRNHTVVCRVPRDSI